jgi:hypothetical protein
MKGKKPFCFCVAVLLLTGCMKTPETDAVVQKNTEALVSKATEEDENRKPLAENREETPKHYSWNYDNGAGTVHIDAESDVTLPESETIPMYKLSSTGFTQEQVTGLYDYLFEGRETYQIQGESFTKEACEKKMVNIKKEIEDLEKPGDGSEEWEEESREQSRTYLRERLEELSAEYDGLPTESELKKIPVDATLVEKTSILEGDDGAYEEKTLEMHCESDAGDRLSVTNVPVDSGAWPNILYRKEGKYDYDGVIGLPVTPEEANEKKSAELPYSYEEAKALADGAVREAGVEGEVAQTELMEGEIRGEESAVSSGEYTAFRFRYARRVDGIPVAVTSSTYISGDETAQIWSYEQLMITVSEVGIQDIRWEAPISLDETVTSDVPILSFDDAAAVFEEVAPLAYEGKWEAYSEEPKTDCTMEIHVDKVCLSLMRVKNDGSKRQGLYVPAWVFYGTETKIERADSQEDSGGEDSWSSTEDVPWIVLAVNAVDGTVIDQVEGY